MTLEEFRELLLRDVEMTPAMCALALLFISADKLKAAGFIEVNYWPFGAKTPAWTAKL